MRIALIADIHGNRLALETALAHIQRQPVDRIICLGDVVSFGPEPAAALRLIRELGCPAVMGNADDSMIAARFMAAKDEDTTNLRALGEWGRTQLTDEDLAFMRTFQPTVSVSLDDGQNLLCYHGSPNSFNDIMIATTPEEELLPFLEGTPARIYTGGHTHRQFIREHRSSLIMNPGSVGIPYYMLEDGQTALNPTIAEYAIIESVESALSVTFYRVPYSLDALQHSIRASGMPNVQWFIEDWVQG